MMEISRSEVAEHNSNSSTWMHPGGCEVLLEKAGQDGTEAFEDIGHSTDAREMRNEFCIGKINEDEKWQYSYDKRSKVENKSAEASLQTKTSDSTTQTTIVYGAMVGIIALIIYYLLLSGY